MHTQYDPLVIVQNEARLRTTGSAKAGTRPRCTSSGSSPPATYTDGSPSISTDGAPYGAGHCNFTTEQYLAAVQTLERLGDLRHLHRPGPDRRPAHLPRPCPCGRPTRRTTTMRRTLLTGGLLAVFAALLAQFGGALGLDEIRSALLGAASAPRWAWCRARQPVSPGRSASSSASSWAGSATPCAPVCCRTPARGRAARRVPRHRPADRHLRRDPGLDAAVVGSAGRRRDRRGLRVRLRHRPHRVHQPVRDGGHDRAAGRRGRLPGRRPSARRSPATRRRARAVQAPRSRTAWRQNDHASPASNAGVQILDKPAEA